MALTFEEYVSGRRRNEQTAGAGKLSFDDYVKMTPQQTAPQNDALMDLAMETVKPTTPTPVLRDNHDRYHDAQKAGINTFRPAYGYGNIDLTDRPVYRNADGTISTVDSFSTNINGKEVLLPQIGRDANGNAVRWTQDQAIDNYLKTGENLGTFKTVEDANNYADWLHNQQENYYSTPSLMERIKETVKSGGLSRVSGDVNTAGVFMDNRGGTVATEMYEEELSDIQKRRGYLADEMQRDPEYANDPEAIWQLAQYDSKIEQLETAIRANKGTAPELFKIADELGSEAAKSETRAKQGLGWLGQQMVNAGSSGVNMMIDRAETMLAPGLGLTSLGVRAFGNSAQEARQEGANSRQQMLYGLANAATEVGSELLGDIPGRYGGGLLDEAVEGVIKRIAKTPAVETLAKLVASTVGESLEELVAGAIEPGLKSIYDNEGFFSKEHYNKETLIDTAEAMFVGGFLGALGGGTQVGIEAVQNIPQARLNKAVDNAYKTMEQNGMFSPEAAEANQKARKEINRSGSFVAPAEQTATVQPMKNSAILDMALSEDSRLTDEGKAVAREMYNLTRGEDTAPLDFIAGFNDVYDAARRGESPDSIQSEAAARLTPQARAAAYDAGLEAMRADTAERYSYSVRENDGEYTVVIHDAETGRDNPMQSVSTREEAEEIVKNFKGVTESVESGSQGEIRDAGVPGREGRGGLRERAEKNRAWRETRKRDAEGIRNRVEAAGDGEKVSAREAGISGGTDAKTMSIVRTYRDADMRKMESEAAAHGVKVVFFSGEIEARKGGKTIKARGEYSADGKTFYVAVDDPDFTARQIFDHEDFHARAHTDAELQQICEDIINAHSAAELQELVNAYVNTYGWTSMSDEDILQEILADAYAGIDVFQYLYSFEGATQFTEAVRGAVKERESEKQQTRGPPAEDEAPGKFSMKAPVEETRTLVAQHNLTEEKLRRMQQLGAIPAPSIAIVQAKEGHTNFGEYSIVFPRSTIDPQADYRNRIYGSDAWTPTSANARVEYPVNYKALKSVEEKIDRLSGQIAGGVFRTTSLLRSMGIDNTSDMTPEEIARRMADKDAVRAAYLADQGQTLEPEKREKTWNRNFSNDTLRRFVNEVGAQRLAQITSDLWEGVRMEEALGNDLERVRQAMRDEYAERGESLLQRMGQKHGWSEKEINAKREERIDRSMERINYYQIEDFVKDAWQMYEDGGATKGEVDSLATSDKLRDAVDRKDAEKWALEQIKDLLGEPGVYNGKDIFTPSGRSRTFAELHYPYTAEGIVQAMYGSTDGSRGVGLYGAGANGLVSVATPEYDSVEAIHKDEKRLQTLTEEEYKERLAAIDSYIDTFVRSVKQNNKAHAASSYEEGEIIGSILIDAAQGRRTVSSVQKTFRNEGYNLTEEQAKSALALYKKAATIPTSYFEAKPERVVNFGEALAIIIPDNAPADIKQFAKNSFADVIEYKAGNDQDRIEKVNSVEGARFSQKITPQQDAEYSAAVERGDMETAQKMVDEAAKAAGYDIKVYRGGGQKHNVFDTKRGAGDTQFGPGTYFTDAYGLAQDWAKERAHTSDDNGYVGEYYIKVQNLFSDDSTDFNTEQWENVERALKDRGVSERELKRIKSWGFYGIAQALQSVGEIEDGSFTPFSWRNAPKVNQILREAGYDGIEAPFYDSRQYVIFDPEQAKSADPVTYDDNGNVIPLSERFNPEKQDIRFSQKLTAEDELRQQNDELQKLVDYWRGQTKRTTVPAVRTDDAEKVARDFVKTYNSKLNVKDAAAAVKALAEYIQSENVTWAEVKDRAYGIARDVVENAEALREGDGATYDEVKTALKKPLIISAQDAHDISPEWGAWRNANVGKVNVSINGKGTPVDVAYAELSERFPSLFPESITHPADQVQQMVDVVIELAPVYENPFSYNMAEAIEYCANDLISRVYGENIRMAPPTFADRAAARLEAEKARGAEKTARVREQKNAEIADLKARNAWATAQRIAEVRKQRDAKIAALKEHYAESRKVASERRADSAARTRLLKIIRRLNNKKLPAVNRAWLEEKIGDLDTVAKSITGETIKDLTRLRSWYDNQKANNPDFIADAATEAKIARLSQTRISDLTLSQVQELTEVLLNFENEIANQRKLIDSLDMRDTRQMVLESLYNVEETKGSQKTAADWIVTNTLSPERLVKRLTGYAETDPLLMRTRDLADGQRRMFDYQRRAEKKFSRWANDKKLMERLRSKERIKITGYSHGRAVEAEITPDMRMALYLHSLNDENMKHIANGGVTIPDIGIYLKGDIGEAYNRGKTLKLSPSNVRSIAAGMSAEERAFARAAHDYFNGMSRDEINAVSEKLVGYSIAGVEDYFPIETDKNFTKADIAELKRDGTIEGMGFLKERQKASNAIYLVPMTDVLNKSIQNHAKYVGMAIPVRNFSKVWGMNAHNDAAGEDNGLRQAIGQKWGERGIKAIERIISDVQNPSRSEDGKLLASIRSNYAAAVLTLNASVALKQAASYPTAAAVLGWEPLLKAMGNVGSVNLDLIDKYTPLQWYRSKGFSTQELGDIRNKGGVMDNVLSASIKTKSGREVPLLNWIQGIDLATTRKLWKASEYYVQQHNADLERGSDAYYKAVADIYNRVIEETQPNYTTMQRPQILRSSNQLLQSLVMFKTQPFQNFNILYDAIGELRAAERAAKNGDKSRLTQAKKNAVNAISSNLVSAVVFAAMTMAWAYARRKKDKYEDKEGNFSPWKQLGKDVLSSELGMVPFGSDAYNLLSSWVFGDKYYGMSNITAESISGALDATKKAVDTLSGVVTALLDGDDATNAEPETIAKELFDCAKDLSKIAGLPLENVVNLMAAVYTNVADAVNGEYVTGYELLRSTKNMESSYNKSAAYDMLYKAKNQDMEQYNELRRMMIEDGFKEKNIDEAMKKRAEKK